MNKILVVIIATGALLVGFFYWRNQKNNNLENFDEIMGKLGNPVLIEAKLQELSLQAKKLSNNSIYLQMLSQIALMQAVQQKFDQAHATLDDADKQLQPKDYVAAVRLLLERGRVFQQAGDIDQAKKYFDESYELSKLHDLDFHTINAAHMIAIVVSTLEEKIAWNELALSLALQTQDKKAVQWLAPLYNNLGQNYFDAKDYEKSLEHYQKALILFQNDARYSHANFIFAQWTIARCMRALGRVDEAFALQNELLLEIKNIENSKQYGMPEEMFFLIRGFVYEELAEICIVQNDNQQAKIYAQVALQDLANNEMFVTTSPERIEHLQKLLKNFK